MADQDHEFAMVLSNKQVLSVFFLITVAFGVFFFFGYSVGYDRADLDQELGIKTIDPIVESPETVRVPDALLRESSAITIKSKPETIDLDNHSAESSSRNKSSRPDLSQKNSTGSYSPSKTRSSTVARSIHLQVAALRVQSDARLLAEKLNARGYPASLFSHGGDGWVRVLVGPFATTDEAQEYRSKLKAEGFHSILRKP